MGISNDIRPKKLLDESKVNRPEKVAKIVDLDPADVKDVVEPVTTKDQTPEKTSDLEKDFFKTKTKDKPKVNATIKKKPVFLIIVLILMVLGLIGVAAYQNLDLIKTKLFHKPSETPASTAKDITDTSTSQNTETQTGVSTTPTDTSTTASTTPTPPATIDKQSFSIRVSNGSGVKNAAANVAKILVDAGFKVTSQGNAQSTGYKTTIVYFKKGKDAEAELVKTALSTRTVSSQLSTTLTLYDILVIVGKN